MSTKPVTYREILHFAMHYWRRRARVGFLLFALMIAATMTDIFVPVYTGKIIDALARAEAPRADIVRQVIGYLAVFIGLGIAFAVLRSASSATWNWFSSRNLYDILTEATARVQRFSSDWHANTFAGATVRKITRGMWAFDMLGDTLFIGLLPAIVIMTGMAIMLFLHMPPVGLFAALMIVIYSATSIIISLKLLRPRFRESAAADTEVGAHLADMITGNATVKSFGAESREEESFLRVASHWRYQAFRAWQTAEVANLIRNTLRTIMMGGMVGITIWLWTRGQASAGDIALSITSFFIISGYMRDIGMQIAQLQRSASEMEDIVIFQKQEMDIDDAPGAAVFKPGKGEIVFDHVTFAYKGQTPLYDDFSLRIAPGERVALVGASGAGKSTFVKLVQRLYDLQGGAIRIDGQDISQVTQISLRQSIALVPQEPILFHRSLAENISYGRPGATQDDIIEAARKAYAHDFIALLPGGYDTLVGERGIKLSGGERQRVALARAILADAPILVLDEATSSLDSISEHYIQKALAELMKGRTSITIAHRLSTIRAVDRILVFEAGRIIEEGSHADLAANPQSHYRRLYDMQTLGLIGD